MTTPDVPVLRVRPGARRPRLILSLAALLALVLGSLALPAATAHHAGPAPGPVHAGSTFGWGHRGATVYREEFIGHLPKRWKKSGRGQVRDQHGMLTLNTRRHGSVSATRHGGASATGRWEIRLRSRRYTKGAANYRVMTELVPAKKSARHCGARNIALESYRAGTRNARFSVRNQGLSFSAAKRVNTFDQRWHTFAVEVTRTHVSWFVDAHVIRTEKRAAALSGVPLTLRFTMAATKGARMNRSRMQMDWMRHWSLRSENQKSIAAPNAVQGIFPGGC